MLYINGKKASRLQNILSTIYFESKNIRETIIQYNKCCDIENEELFIKFDEYPNLFSTILESMRYRIVIGMGNLFDKDKACASIIKLLNICESEGISDLNKVVKKIKKELGKYAELDENIKILRDRMYGHIDVAYALEEEEIFDIDFEKLNKQFKESLKLLNYIMNECANLSIAYDNDTMGLRVSRKFDLVDLK